MEMWEHAIAFEGSVEVPQILENVTMNVGIPDIGDLAPIGKIKI